MRRRWQRRTLPVVALLLCIIAGLAACNRQSRPSPAELYQRARSSFESGDLPGALQASNNGRLQFEKSQPEWAWRFRVLNAEVLVWQGKSKDALAVLAEDIPPFLASDEAAVRRKLVQAQANYYLQNFGPAEILLSDAERLAVGGQQKLLADVLLAHGVLLIMRADYPAAISNLQHALELATQYNNKYLQTTALGNLAATYMRQQRYDQSIDAANAALQLARTLHNRTLSTKLLGNLGWCYYKLGDFENAMSSFTQAEATSAQLGLARDQHVWLMDIGLVLNDSHDYPRAAEYYQKALGLARKLENRSAAASCLSNLASTSLSMQQFDKAEEFNREAFDLKQASGDSDLYPRLNQARIAAGRRQFSEATKLLNEVIAKSGDDASLRWEAQSELANIYAAQNNNAAAEREFRTALATIDKARAALSKEEHRLSFLGSAERFYNDYIDFLVSRGRTTEALGIAEHSRARTLAEGLKIPVAGVLSASFSPEQTARKLNSVILAYWLKPGQSYLWTVTPSRVVLSKLPPGDQIDSEIQSYRKALLGPRDVKDTTNNSGTHLYEMLVAPAQNLIAPGARVVVIGDRSLNLLNFETLLVSKPQIHYFIEDALVSNASSIALLARSSRRKPATGQQLLLIGDPIYSGTDFPELKQAKLELQDVASHFPANRRQVLERAAATPAAYAASDADRFAFIHFVAHGTASRTSPLDSSIILSRQSDAYKLYARDIIKQPLRAELVTISACYGAGNRSYSGEGLVGLSWAFLRAGAHNVIAALWEVSDSSTPELMDAMYAGVQSGKDPATALRTAKLKMLHSDTIYRRPFYWGAFQLYSGS